MAQSYHHEPVTSKVSRNSVFFTQGMTLKDIERDVILETLRQNRFNRTRTAKVLGIGIRTLQRKLKLYRETEIHAQHLGDAQSAHAIN